MSSTRAPPGTCMRAMACSPTGRCPRSIDSPLPARAHSLNSVRSCSAASLLIADLYRFGEIFNIGSRIWQHGSSQRDEFPAFELNLKPGEFVGDEFASEG